MAGFQDGAPVTRPTQLIGRGHSSQTRAEGNGSLASRVPMESSPVPPVAPGSGWVLVSSPALIDTLLLASV